MYSTFHSLLIKAIELSPYRNTCISVSSCYCFMLMPIFLYLKMTKLKNHMAEQSVLIIVCDMPTHWLANYNDTLFPEGNSWRVWCDKNLALLLAQLPFL